MNKFHHALLPLALAACLNIAPSTAQAQQLIDPNALVGSYSQSYLAAQLAQWELLYPAATNPLLDTTGAQAAKGDMGSFFFLSASLTDTPVVRNVTVQAGQTLVFSPIAIIYWADAVVNTEAAMRAEATSLLGTVSNLNITVDGAPALLPAGVSSTQAFRQSSPLFPLSLGADNIFGYATGVYPAVSEGFLFALEGLAPGNHQLRFTALMESTGPYTGTSFAQDITYNITAVPEASTLAMMGLGLALVAGRLARRRREALLAG